MSRIFPLKLSNDIDASLVSKKLCRASILAVVSFRLDDTQYWIKRRRIPLLEGTALPRKTLENYVKLWMEYIRNLPRLQSSLWVFEVALMAEKSIYKTRL